MQSANDMEWEKGQKVHHSAKNDRTVHLTWGPFRSDHFLVHFGFSLQFTLHNIFTCPPECWQRLPNLSHDFPKQKFLKESRFGRKFMVMNESRYQRFVFIHVFTFENIFICCLDCIRDQKCGLMKWHFTYRRILILESH